MATLAGSVGSHGGIAPTGGSVPMRMQQNESGDALEVIRMIETWARRKQLPPGKQHAHAP